MPLAQRRIYDQGCTITLCHCDFEYRFIFILVPDVQLEVEVIFSQEESSLYPLASLLLSEGQNFQCLLYVSHSLGDHHGNSCLKPAKIRSKI